MKNAKREIVDIGKSLLFLDSINFFHLDPEDQKTLLVYGPGRIADEFFITKKDAKKALGDLAKKFMFKRKNIILFGKFYIIPDKISCYLKEEKEECCSLKIFFENGQIVYHNFPLGKEKELDELISELNFGRSFEVTEKLILAFQKINGLHADNLESNSELIIEVAGHEIPIHGKIDDLRVVVSKLFAFNEMISETTFS